MTASRAFDRAASFYDRTRALPEDAMREVVAALLVELQGRGRVLEIGVGTGRIALPLHDAGVSMTGVDLSRPMMAVLAEKAGGTPPFPLEQADATALPVAARSFGAALASHVFHLIPNWPDAVSELVRVVQPGGAVLTSSQERGAESVLSSVHRRMHTEAGLEQPHIGAPHEGNEVGDAFARHGAFERQLAPVHVRRALTISALIDSIEARQWSWTWPLPDDVLQRAAGATREWAERDIGSLDAEHVVETQVVWRAYDLPG
jgi:SAM-dependent methyltransferase